MCDYLCRVLEELLAKLTKEASADVAVRVRGRSVVDIEQAIVAVLVVVTANVDRRVAGVEVPVIARGPGESIGTAQVAPTCFLARFHCWG